MFVLENATASFTLPTQPSLASNDLLLQRSACPHLLPGLGNWHDPLTWPDGKVPAGGNVTLPAGVSVLLSSCSTESSDSFGSIVIPANSTLVFADAIVGVNITAQSINVIGTLAAGSETCRLRGYVTITLTGKRPYVDSNITAAQMSSLDAPAMAKGLVVDGTLDLHGAQYSPTWTRLAVGASAGDTTVWLQERVNWEVGRECTV